MATVVIIGGGFVGAQVASKLEQEYDVVLIDTKDYFEYTPGILRTIVVPRHAKYIQKLHSHYLEEAQIVNDRVVAVDETKVITEERKIAYDYLVIGSGSDYHLPIKEENSVISARLSSLRNCHTALEESETVLLIGGGIVGVELAAEIVEEYPDKRVKLVHSQDVLMPRRHPETQWHGKRHLEKKGDISIILEDRVEKSGGDGVFQTQHGQQLYADIAFLCTGISPNSLFLQEHMESVLNEKGFVRVNAYMQVGGYSHIFAGGDVTDIPEEKTAQCAETHAQVIVDNIRSVAQGSELRSYSAGPIPLVISLGKWDGIFEYKGFVMTGFIPALMKKFIEWKTMWKYT